MFPEQLIIFDLEYGDMAISSIHGATPCILEIGAIRVLRDGTFAGMFSSLIQPRKWEHVTEKIKAITKLEDADLKGAPDFAEQYDEFARFCGNTPLACWGMTDCVFLRMETVLIGKEWRLNNSSYDLRSLAAAAYFNAVGTVLPAGLGNACKELAIKRGNHRAENDCKTALHVFEAIQDLSASQGGEDEEEFKLYDC
jgi:DNA polymerase III epsilon subunit-like protein